MARQALPKLPAKLEELNSRVEQGRITSEHYPAVIRLMSSAESIDKLHDLKLFWSTMEKYFANDVHIHSCWVTQVLSMINDSIPDPAISKKQAQKVENELRQLLQKTRKIMIENRVDPKLLQIDSKTFSGLYKERDFSFEKRNEAKRLNIRKISTSTLLESHFQHIIEDINENALEHGQHLTGAEARIFARTFSAKLKSNSGSPLIESVSIATNAIYKTSYDKASMVNTLNREQS